MPSVAIKSFNTGLVTPKIDARSDLEKFGSACRYLDNFLPLEYGCAEERPGTEFIYESKHSPQGCRLIPFVYSAEIAYMCEFGDLYSRFYYDGAILLDGGTPSLPVEITTTYLVADLPALQYHQIADTMWITHEDYPQRKLTRTSVTSFAINDITFKNGPFRTRNDLIDPTDLDTSTMEPSDNLAVGDVGTLTCSEDYFIAGHIGQLYALTQPRVNTIVAQVADGISDWLDVKGTFSFITHGTWTGTVLLERRVGSEEAAAVETYRTYIGVADRNVQLTATEREDNVQYRINSDDDMDLGFSADITVHNSTQKGVVKITAIQTTKIAETEVMVALASDAVTRRWAEGAWSISNGFPAAICFYGNRCVYAGTPTDPQVLWLSAVGDYEGFSEGVNDSDSFSVQLTSTDEIRWIQEFKRGVVIGTSGGNWSLTTSDINTPLAPTNYLQNQQKGLGSSKIQAETVGDSTLFVDYVGRRVLEYAYSPNLDVYSQSDMSLLSENITVSSINAVALQMNPDTILWNMLDNGKLLSMTFNREQNIVAWAEHYLNLSAIDSSGRDWYICSSPLYPTLQDLDSGDIPTAPTEPVDGAQSTPQTITSAQDLQDMENDPTDDYILGNSIDMATWLETNTWTPIVGFSGIFNGADFSILNLVFDDDTEDNVGIFATLLTGAEIRDVILNTFTITGDDSVGALVGRIDDQQNIIIKNVAVRNSTIIGDENVGGMLGRCDSTGNIQIYNCYSNDTDVTGLGSSGSATGGLIGYFSVDNASTVIDKITGCYVYGTATIEGEYDLGGVIGIASGHTDYYLTLHSCYADEDITIQNPTDTSLHAMGGFAGEIVNTNTTSCYSKATIVIDGGNANTIGGFVGKHTGLNVEIDCYSEGDLTLGQHWDSLYSVGGYAGLFVSKDSVILGCYSSSDITITNYPTSNTHYGIGGFIGTIDGPAGAEDEEGSISRCYTSGDIYIAILDTTVVSNSCAIGGFAGGAVDYPPKIENCYSWSSITAGTDNNNGHHWIGGFIGSISDASNDLNANFDITNCYVAQTDEAIGSGFIDSLYDTGDDEVGGFLGVDQSNFILDGTACFWDITTSSVTGDDSDAVGHVTAVMQTKATYEDAGWDFDDIWTLTVTTVALSQDAVGTVQSIAKIPSSDEDEIWAAVLIEVEGTPRRYITRMKPRLLTTLTACFFVDCGTTITNSPVSSTLAGLDHLEGLTVTGLIDGVVMDDAVVSDGQVTAKVDGTETTVSTGHVGLPFTYKLQPMRPTVDTREGTSHSSKLHVPEMGISFLNTLGAKYGTSDNALESIDFDYPDWVNNTEIEGLFTGDMIVSVDGGFTLDAPLIISSDAPLPCTVRALIPKLNVTSR